MPVMVRYDTVSSSEGIHLLAHRADNCLGSYVVAQESVASPSARYIAGTSLSITRYNNNAGNRISNGSSLGIWDSRHRHGL